MFISLDCRAQSDQPIHSKLVIRTSSWDKKDTRLSRQDYKLAVGAMSTVPQFQAVILAGGGGSHLYPLNTAGLPKVLMPVANRPLLTFPLRTLEEAGITDVLVVCEGDAAASAVRSWVIQHASGSGIEVLKVAEGLPSVDALRQVMGRIKSENCVVLSGDVVTEIPLRAQLLQHQLRGATVTALFGRRKTSPAADTQPGKPPRNVDYVGLAAGDRLAYFNHSPEATKEVALPHGALRRHPTLALTTRLVDMQVYVFCTSALRGVLEERPELLKLEAHLLPYLARRQAPMPTDNTAAAPNRGGGASFQHASNSSLGSEVSGVGHQSAVSLATMGDGDSTGGHHRSGSGSASGSGWICGAYVAPEGSYCQRANTLQGYADVNREAVTAELAPKLLHETPSTRGENFLAPSVTLGNKVTIGSACMIGAESSLGDKCSVKRSVIGRGCSFGSNVKIINSVLMDGVHVGDNCHVQNSIVCGGCTIQAKVEVMNCQVGPNYKVATGSQHKGEVLANKK